MAELLREIFTKNTSYYCYNQDVLAVADGKVVEIQDGNPENIPHSDKLAVKMGTKTFARNNIYLDLATTHLPAYGHLNSWLSQRQSRRSCHTR